MLFDEFQEEADTAVETEAPAAEEPAAEEAPAAAETEAEA